MLILSTKNQGSSNSLENTQISKHQNEFRKNNSDCRLNKSYDKF